jgi:hypothetical protein
MPGYVVIPAELRYCRGGAAPSAGRPEHSAADDMDMDVAAFEANASEAERLRRGACHRVESWQICGVVPIRPGLAWPGLARGGAVRWVHLEGQFSEGDSPKRPSVGHFGKEKRS